MSASTTMSMAKKAHAENMKIDALELYASIR
jgi:hypothetical protein